MYVEGGPPSNTRKLQLLHVLKPLITVYKGAVNNVQYQVCRCR